MEIEKRLRGGMKMIQPDTEMIENVDSWVRSMKRKRSYRINEHKPM
jgi:hypothetical protein